MKRDGLWNEKYSDVPFMGEVDGIDQGSFKDGRREGPWVEYTENEQVFWKRTYKDDKLNGLSVTFHENGQYASEKTHKDGEIDGLSVSFYDNGQSRNKGNYKDGKRKGPWVFYNKGGIKRVTKDKHGFDEGSGTYRNGKKISD